MTMGFDFQLLRPVIDGDSETIEQCGDMAGYPDDLLVGVGDGHGGGWGGGGDRVVTEVGLGSYQGR